VFEQVKIFHVLDRAIWLIAVGFRTLKIGYTFSCHDDTQIAPLKQSRSMFLPDNGQSPD
jgi:hypothetical protein